MSVPSTESRIVRFGLFEVDLQQGELRRSGLRQKLGPQPFQVLQILLERKGEIVTRDELRERLWPADTFVDYELALKKCVNRIREALGDSADNPRFIETVPRRGYRFIAPVEQLSGLSAAAPSNGPRESGASAVTLVPDPDFSVVLPREHRTRGGIAITAAGASAPAASREPSRKRRAFLVLAAIFLAAISVVAFLRFHPVQALTEKDTIVLADFSNSTGDPVFDETLRQALAVQLGQSPFLNILSDTRERDILLLMRRASDARVDLDTAREICQRTGSTAVLSGSIARLGNQYVLGLNALNCQSGDVLARQQVQAAGKEQVLAAMDDAGRKLRIQLGESLSSLQKFGTPVEQATTSSFEALEAFSRGQEIGMNQGPSEAIPLFQRAIELDPKFAMAYGILGAAYFRAGKDDLGLENIQKAYQLRDRASEREKFRIAAYYSAFVTGDLEKMRENCEQWVVAYPRDWEARDYLGGVLVDLGQYESSAKESSESVRLNPDSLLDRSHLVFTYLALGGLDEVEITLRDGEKREGDYPAFHFERYRLAFLRADEEGMEQQAVWAAGKPEVEDQLLGLEADTAAYSGRLARARELSDRAVASAQRAGEKEKVAHYEADAALREALIGNSAEARRRAAVALSISSRRQLQCEAAMALSFGADVVRAQALAGDLARRFPEDTLVQSVRVPTIYAQLALDRKDASRAIRLLQSVAPYELAAPLLEPTSLHSVYVRGDAYLAALKSTEAAAEFQKILAHRGAVLNSPIGALAHLQIGRAYAMQGDTAKARPEYQDFLALWKDADPDIPILKQAKAEYAKLQ